MSGTSTPSVAHEHETGRSGGIDVLRGVAVALVMARHAFPDLFPGAGVVGVVMFFALSGFLITSSLCAEHARTGTVSLRGFYLRRARRLVPALVAMLLGFTVVVLLLDPLGDRGTLPGTWLVALTWTANLPLGIETSEAAFHLWTLAGEEQFYLLWPLLLLWAWPRARTPHVVLALLLLSGAGIGLSWLWLGSAADVAYALPTSWAACFVLGGAARLLVVPRMRVESGWWWAPRVTWMALAVLVVLALLPVRGHWWTYLAVAPVVSLLTVGLLLQVRRVPGALDLPGHRAWAWLGRRSYAAYLWNYPLALWLRTQDDILGPWAGAVAAVLTLAAAEASWRWVERRFITSTATDVPADRPRAEDVFTGAVVVRRREMEG